METRNDPKIRVLVAEDSLTVRRALVEAFGGDPEIDVVGEAANGRQAVELCRRLRPDVITMDMMMPEMTGLEATEYIMAHSPTPILIVSASTNRMELFKTYDALAAGAVDVLEKPLGDGMTEEWRRKFISSVKLVSKIKVITHLRGKLNSHSSPRRQPPPPLRTEMKNSSFRCVALGASTGGPNALVEILHKLPGDFPLPILLVIHIGQPFGQAFAEWLDTQSPLRVRYAMDGESLPCQGCGQVIMAPPDQHLRIRDGKLSLSSDAERHSCRPSVDVLFESVAAECGENALACLLTGMGRDGALGLLAVRNAGGMTIAQDESTSIVFGMPREAIRLQAAKSVLPLNAIAEELVTFSQHAPRERKFL